MTPFKDRLPSLRFFIPTAFLVLSITLLGFGELAVRYLHLQPLPQPDENTVQFLLEAWGPSYKTITIGDSKKLIKKPRHRNLTAPWEAEQTFSVQKSSTTYRIGIMGESSAFILFEEVARPLLNRDDIEVMNFAIGGGTLEMMTHKVPEILDYRLDALVLLFGHNSIYRRPHLRPWMHWPGRWACKSRLFSVLANKLRSEGEPVQMWPDHTAPERMQSFLERIGRETKHKGVRLILCTVPSNLRAPVRTEHRETEDPQFLHLRYLYDCGRRQEAIEGLRDILITRPIASWHYQLADWLFHEKDYGQAYKHYTRARDLDSPQNRATSTTNDIIRQSALKWNADLLDLERVVSDLSPTGIPGWDSFRDSQHVSHRGVKIEAEKLLSLLGKLPTNTADYVTPPGDTTPFKTILSAAEHMQLDPNLTVVGWMETRLDEIARDGERWLSEEFTDSQERARVAIYAAEAFWRNDRRTEAFHWNRRAKELAPEYDETLFQKGRFWLGLRDRERAIKAFESSRRLNPGRKDVEFYLKSTVAEGKILF